METNNIAHKVEEGERTTDIKLSEKVPFRKMMLSERVRRGLTISGFVYPTVLQSSAIPLGRAGIDILIQSKSGTGKTLIFCITILDSYDSSIKAPQSLVLVPTREIAVQIESVLNQVGKYLPDFVATSVIGGTDVHIDRKRLLPARAIVGTPGRVMHLIRSSILNTEYINLLVIDEADKFLDESFRKTLEEINSALTNKKQTIACSATLNMELDVKLAKYMKNPLLLSAEKRIALLVGIKQFVHKIPEEKTNIAEMSSKVSALKRIFSKISFKQCIVFVNSQSRAETYCSYLEKDGWRCEFITGAQEQTTRLDKFRRFREFKIRILFATDLMSRGIDSENLNLVINLEVPDDAATYLHRIGRAGRFGTYGLAISFIATKKDCNKFRNILNSIGSKMVVFKYQENNTMDLWSFSDREAEKNEFEILNLSDSDADKENNPENDKKLTVSLKKDNDCKIETEIGKKPLNDSINGQLTFTISNSSQKIPSNTAITLDDASSLTVDSDIMHRESKKPSIRKDAGELCANNVTETQPTSWKLSPIDLVLDTNSSASLIRGDLFDDYHNAAVSSTSIESAQTCPPNTSESSEIIPRTGRYLREELSLSMLSDVETISSQGVQKNRVKNIEDSFENYTKLKNLHKENNTCNVPGPSSSSAMDQSTLNASNSGNINRVSYSDTDLTRDSTDSDTSNSLKLSGKKVDHNSSCADDSNYSDNLESDASDSGNVPSSGFEEKVPTEASSGIVTSTEFSDSDSDSVCTFYSTSTSTEDGYARSEQDSYESSSSDDSSCDKLNLAPLIEVRPNNADARYKYAQGRWNNIYLQQMNQIKEYVNISKCMKRVTLQFY